MKSNFGKFAIDACESTVHGPKGPGTIPDHSCEKTCQILKREYTTEWPLKNCLYSRPKALKNIIRLDIMTHLDPTSNPVSNTTKVE